MSTAGCFTVAVWMVNCASGCGSPITLPTPTNPAPGTLTHIRSPVLSRRNGVLYHSPPPAETNPYCIASAQERVSSTGTPSRQPKFTYHSPFQLDSLNTSPHIRPNDRAKTAKYGSN